MTERQVRNRGADLHLLGGVEQGRDEHQAVGNVLDRVGQMLAAIAFGVAKPVRQNKRLAVLLQCLNVIPARRMHRHGEEPELHGLLRNEALVWSSAWRWTMR